MWSHWRGVIGGRKEAKGQKFIRTESWLGFWRLDLLTGFGQLVPWVNDWPLQAGALGFIPFERAGGTQRRGKGGALAQAWKARLIEGENNGHQSHNFFLFHSKHFLQYQKIHCLKHFHILPWLRRPLTRCPEKVVHNLLVLALFRIWSFCFHFSHN